MAQGISFMGCGRLGMVIMITVNILFFSTIRAIIGHKNLVLELPDGSTVRDLKGEIGCRFPDSAQAILTMLTSVNRVFSSDDTVLADQAEVAFFPFVSGG
jgi:molybdopterin converting factor small subunit